MYISFQSDSVAYSEESSKFMAGVLYRGWNNTDNNNNRISPDAYFEENYGIIFDNNERGVIIGVAVPDHIYTLLLLQHANSI